MTVNDDQAEDGRSRPRWSAGKKLDVVLRLLVARSSTLWAVSSAWKPPESPPGATTSSPVARRRSKGAERPLSGEDRQPGEAERKIGELTIEVEVWRGAAEQRGAAMPPAGLIRRVH